MRRSLWVFVIFIAATQLWAAKAISVGQLEDMLRSMQQQKKSDAEIADALKQVQLSEELTVSTMNGLIQYVPGRLATEQIYVLAARSADLAPPAADLPSTPAPDAAVQKAILDKAAGYVANVYGKLPALTATKTTLRFQDNMEVVVPSSGIKGSATEVVTTPGFSNGASYMRYIKSTVATVLSKHGAERPLVDKDNSWGANRMIAIHNPDPDLSEVFGQAQAAETLHWLRWELVNGKQVGVFSFSVPKDRTRMDLQVCCFPYLVQMGVARFYTATTAAAFGGSGPGGGVSGNMQTTTNWRDFKSVVPYHGKFFIDPDTGAVVRMITEAELKPTDPVLQLDTRIDYGPQRAGGATLLVPARVVINSVVVPNGVSGAGVYSKRCTLFTSEYKDYRPAGAE